MEDMTPCHASSPEVPDSSNRHNEPRDDFVAGIIEKRETMHPFGELVIGVVRPDHLPDDPRRVNRAGIIATTNTVPTHRAQAAANPWVRRKMRARGDRKVGARVDLVPTGGVGEACTTTVTKISCRESSLH